MTPVTHLRPDGHGLITRTRHSDSSLGLVNWLGGLGLIRRDRLRRILDSALEGAPLHTVTYRYISVLLSKVRRFTDTAHAARALLFKARG